MPPKSSKFRGVTLFRPTKKWRAQISAAGKTTSLGDHDTEEEAARAFDRAAINKAGAAAATNYPIEDYHHEIDALRQVSVSELVATLRAKARRHGTQTSQYRGVSLLKQTGKWHGQINVGGKQLHLGFFSTEELAARAYDRAAIHKASVEGGVIVTNLDISQYRGEIEKLQSMTRKELLSMIADEKKTAAMVGGGAHQQTEEEEEEGEEEHSQDDLRMRLDRAAEEDGEEEGERRGVSPGGSSQDTDTDGGGSGSGGGGERGRGRGGVGGNLPVGFERTFGAFGRRSKSSSSSQLTHHDERDPDADDDTPDGVNTKSRGVAQPDTDRESPPVTSSREGEAEGEGLRPVAVALRVVTTGTGRHTQRGAGPVVTAVVTGQTAAQVEEESSKKSSGGDQRSHHQQQGTKRPAAEVITQSPSPRAAGKQRRTKQAPRQAPMAA